VAANGLARAMATSQTGGGCSAYHTEQGTRVPGTTLRARTRHPAEVDAQIYRTCKQNSYTHDL